jgi:methyl-accepting chemotaxis protein
MIRAPQVCSASQSIRLVKESVVSIRAFLLCAFAILALMLVGLAGFSGFRVIQTYRMNESFLDTDATTELLLKAAADLAIERGLSNAPLHAPAPLSAERRTEIERVRANADQAIRDGIGRLRSVPEMANALGAIDDFERSYRDFGAFRQRVDGALRAPAASRPVDVVDSLAPTIAMLVDQISSLRMTLEALTEARGAELAQLLQLRQLTAVMAEAAGRERAIFGGNIARRHPFSRDDLRAVSEHRGQIGLVWSVLQAVRQRSDLPVSLSAAIASVDQEFVHNLADLRSGVLAHAEDGNYPIGGLEWVDRSGVAQSTILKLSAEASALAHQMAGATASQSKWWAIVYLALVSGSLVVAIGSFAMMIGRVIRPLAKITDAIEKLSRGDKTARIPAATRQDEIGRMAAAVQVFKQNLVVNEQLQVERMAENEAKMQRAQRLEQLMRGLERQVGGLVQSLSSASAEMEATALSMSSAAEQSNRQAIAVASSAEQTSSNVQSVAAATEELRSSIGEIGRQAADSSRIARKAVADARGTDAIAQALAAGAQKIGEVVSLINEIAGQTGLLALNATIEAARAGEAGRGFAVVASEVKQLATQTAHATGEIAAQIQHMQDATKQAVASIQGIGATIQEMDRIAAAIAAAVGDQGAVMREISHSVQQAATGAQEVTGSLILVKDTARDTGEAATGLLDAAGQLSRNSGELHTQVDEFLAALKAA